jgi:hypothetical protein
VKTIVQQRFVREWLATAWHAMCTTRLRLGQRLSTSTLTRSNRHSLLRKPEHCMKAAPCRCCCCCCFTYSIHQHSNSSLRRPSDSKLTITTCNHKPATQPPTVSSPELLISSATFLHHQSHHSKGHNDVALNHDNNTNHSLNLLSSS